MVFGLIGGLRLLMWCGLFMQANWLTLKSGILEKSENRKMQALHGPLNICARDYGYRCRCVCMCLK